MNHLSYNNNRIKTSGDASDATTTDTNIDGKPWILQQHESIIIMML